MNQRRRYIKGYSANPKEWNIKGAKNKILAQLKAEPVVLLSTLLKRNIVGEQYIMDNNSNRSIATKHIDTIIDTVQSNLEKLFDSTPIDESKDLREIRLKKSKTRKKRMRDLFIKLFGSPLDDIDSKPCSANKQVRQKANSLPVSINIVDIKSNVCQKRKSSDKEETQISKIPKIQNNLLVLPPAVPNMEDFMQTETVDLIIHTSPLSIAQATSEGELNMAIATHTPIVCDDVTFIKTDNPIVEYDLIDLTADDIEIEDSHSSDISTQKIENVEENIHQESVPDKDDEEPNHVAEQHPTSAHASFDKELYLRLIHSNDQSANNVNFPIQQSIFSKSLLINHKAINEASENPISKPDGAPISQPSSNTGFSNLLVYPKIENPEEEMRQESVPTVAEQEINHVAHAPMDSTIIPTNGQSANVHLPTQQRVFTKPILISPNKNNEESKSDGAPISPHSINQGYSNLLVYQKIENQEAQIRQNLVPRVGEQEPNHVAQHGYTTMDSTLIPTNGQSANVQLPIEQRIFTKPILISPNRNNEESKPDVAPISQPSINQGFSNLLVYQNIENQEAQIRQILVPRVGEHEPNHVAQHGSTSMNSTLIPTNGQSANVQLPTQQRVLTKSVLISHKKNNEASKPDVAPITQPSINQGFSNLMVYQNIENKEAQIRQNLVPRVGEHEPNHVAQHRSTSMDSTLIPTNGQSTNVQFPIQQRVFTKSILITHKKNNDVSKPDRVPMQPSINQGFSNSPIYVNTPIDHLSNLTRKLGPQTSNQFSARMSYASVYNGQEAYPPLQNTLGGCYKAPENNMGEKVTMVIHHFPNIVQKLTESRPAPEQTKQQSRQVTQKLPVLSQLDARTTTHVGGNHLMRGGWVSTNQQIVHGRPQLLSVPIRQPQFLTQCEFTIISNAECGKIITPTIYNYVVWRQELHWFATTKIKVALSSIDFREHEKLINDYVKKTTKIYGTSLLNMLAQYEVENFVFSVVVAEVLKHFNDPRIRRSKIISLLYQMLDCCKSLANTPFTKMFCNTLFTTVEKILKIAPPFTQDQLLLLRRQIDQYRVLWEKQVEIMGSFTSINGNVGRYASTKTIANANPRVSKVTANLTTVVQSLNYCNKRAPNVASQIPKSVAYLNMHENNAPKVPESSNEINDQQIRIPNTSIGPESTIMTVPSNEISTITDTVQPETILKEEEVALEVNSAPLKDTSEDCIDLTWMDDDDLTEIVNECTESKSFPLKTEYSQERQQTISPVDSGFGSPDVQDEGEGYKCLCGKAATHICTCNISMYCSRDCQVLDWPDHQSRCGKRKT